MKLYWGNMGSSYGEPSDNSKLIGEFDSEIEMNKAMMKYLDTLNFKSRYQRLTAPEKKGGSVWIDYGSYSKFFFVTDYKDEYLNRFNK